MYHMHATFVSSLAFVLSATGLTMSVLTPWVTWLIPHLRTTMPEMKPKRVGRYRRNTRSSKPHEVSETCLPQIVVSTDPAETPGGTDSHSSTSQLTTTAGAGSRPLNRRRATLPACFGPRVVSLLSHLPSAVIKTRTTADTETNHHPRRSDCSLEANAPPSRGRAFSMISRATHLKNDRSRSFLQPDDANTERKLVNLISQTKSGLSLLKPTKLLQKPIRPTLPQRRTCPYAAPYNVRFPVPASSCRR